MFNYQDRVIAPRAVSIEGTREYRTDWQEAKVLGFSDAICRPVEQYVGDLFVEFADGQMAWCGRAGVTKF